MILTPEWYRLVRERPEILKDQSRILIECRNRLRSGECDECEFAGVVIAHRVRGLGDVAAEAFRVTGITAAVEAVNGGPCEGCGERQKNLNERFPIGPSAGER